MEILLKTKDLWHSPAQFAVMTILCWRDHDKRGFAAPSKREIAALIGITPRRVNQVYDELEAMEAMARLGPDAEFGGRNRYVLTIEKAIAKKGGGGEARFTPPPDSEGLEGVKPASWGGVAGIMGGDEAGFMGGCSPLHGGVKPATPPWPTKDQKDKNDLKIENAATAAPRLPLFPLALRPPHPQQRAADDAQKVRLQRLRQRVAGLARSILLNPALSRELLNGEVSGALDALVEAAKRLCGRKHVHGYIEVVHAMCTSELFKFRNPNVLNGTAPRPRDRRRR